MSQPRVRLPEALGLRPFRRNAQQALVALRGAEDVPASSFDLSSLGQLRPRWSLPLWRGRAPIPRTALITNLYNHRQTPIEEGWSVRMRQMQDFRGRTLTYDSHNGTDFSIPVGTTVCAAAPGRVVRVATEFNRGGLKITLDHGEGLMTVYAHLARALVTTGEVVHRAQPIALSGYSGLDGLVTFPWGLPHVHMNVWLNGETVDPFGRDGEASLWRTENRPTPGQPEPEAPPPEPTIYDPDALAENLEACKTASVRERIRAIEPLHQRGSELVFEMNYYPTRFPKRRRLTATEHARSPRLDLPFRAEDFDGVAFLDEV